MDTLLLENILFLNQIIMKPELDSSYFVGEKNTLSYAKIIWLTAYLQSKIIGQEELIEKIKQLLITGAMFRVGWDTPINVSICIGPSWVWKNYLWQSVANYLDIPIDIIDLSTYQEYELSSLIGWVGAWWVGNDKESVFEKIFTREVTRTWNIVPSWIILIDEFDKVIDYKSWKYSAVKQLFSVLMNVFESASCIKTKSGSEMNFSNYFIVLCWNLFLDEKQSHKPKKIGFNTSEKQNWSCESEFIEDAVSYIEKEAYIVEKFKSIVPNSVYSRIQNNICIFNELKEDDYDKIIEIEYNSMIYNIRDSIWYVNVEFPDWTEYKDEIKQNIDKALWMRNIRNIINSEILQKIILKYLININIKEAKYADMTKIHHDILTQNHENKRFENIDIFNTEEIEF